MNRRTDAEQSEVALSNIENELDNDATSDVAFSFFESFINEHTTAAATEPSASATHINYTLPLRPILRLNGVQTGSPSIILSEPLSIISRFSPISLAHFNRRPVELGNALSSPLSTTQSPNGFAINSDTCSRQISSAAQP